MRTKRLLFMLTAVVLGAGCGHDATNPTPLIPGSFTLVSIDGQLPYEGSGPGKCMKIWTDTLVLYGDGQYVRHMPMSACGASAPDIMMDSWTGGSYTVAADVVTLSTSPPDSGRIEGTRLTFQPSGYVWVYQREGDAPARP